MFVTLDVTGTTFRLPSEVELGAFRIVQESTSNVARHAQASAISVGVHFDPSSLEVEIADNGRGFEPDEIDEHAGEHLGVVGMRERARLLGGSLDLRSSMDGGTIVRASIPLASGNLFKDHPSFDPRAVPESLI